MTGKPIMRGLMPLTRLIAPIILTLSQSQFTKAEQFNFLFWWILGNILSLKNHAVYVTAGPAVADPLSVVFIFPDRLQDSIRNLPAPRCDGPQVFAILRKGENDHL